MNLPLINQLQIQAIPGGGWVYQAMAAIRDAVATVWDVEHNEDGTHNFANGIKERGRSVALGAWIKPAYSSLSFTAGPGGTVTVTAPAANAAVTPVAYTLIGKTMIVNMDMTITVTGTPSFFTMSIPGGFQVAQPFAGSYSGLEYRCTGFLSTFPALFTAAGGASVIRIERVDQVALPAASNYACGGQLAFEVV